MAAGRLHPHIDECGEEPGEIRDGGILGRDASCRVFCAHSSSREAALRALDQRVTRRNQPDAIQLGGEAVFISGSRGCGEALSQLCDFFCASAAAANFRATAGCGHKVSLGWMNHKPVCTETGAGSRPIPDYRLLRSESEVHPT